MKPTRRELERKALKSERDLRDAVRNAAMQLVNVEGALHRVGLHRTAQAVNRATQRLGWDAADQYTRLAAAKRKRK